MPSLAVGRFAALAHWPALEAAHAEHMSHVLPPRPTGALAPLRGNPEADVIFGAHSGLGLAAFPREIWHETPLGRTFTRTCGSRPPRNTQLSPKRKSLGSTAGGSGSTNGSRSKEPSRGQPNRRPPDGRDTPR